MAEQKLPKYQIETYHLGTIFDYALSPVMTEKEAREIGEAFVKANPAQHRYELKPYTGRKPGHYRREQQQ